MEKDFSEIPVNLINAGADLVLHAPMPGAEPEDILVTIDDDSITLDSQMRGALADDKTLVRHEWRIGDYHRTIPLPHPIDSLRINMTYKNGVLTVTMPNAQKTEPREIRLMKVAEAHGQTQGHAGQGQTRAQI